MKVISHTGKILSTGFGPFDNGHIWLGLSDGKIIAFSYPGLEKTEEI